MRWRRDNSGLLIPDREIVPPSLCELLQINHLIGFGAGGVDALVDAISGLGLTTNMKLCLDAGDALSYAGGTKWLDRSGGGYDYFLGNDATAGAEDPTYVGTSGGLSDQYFQLDGVNDQFAYDTTQEAWMDAMHKDGFIGTVFLVFHSALGVGANYGSTIRGDSAHNGVEISINSGGAMNWSVYRGVGGSPAAAFGSSGVLTLGRWNAVAWNINENGGAGGSFFWANGNYVQVGGADTFNAAYTSPSASAAFGSLILGYASGYVASRFGMTAIWQGSMLSKANLDSLFESIRGRYAI